jgi:glycolate oxidase iron-sulfur subunit
MTLSWALMIGQRLRLVPRRFGLPRLRARSLARRLRFAPSAHADAFLFTGCVMDAWQRDVHRAALEVMSAAGASVARPGPGAGCCGALHHHAGRTEHAHRLAARVIAALPGDRPVVVDSAGCGAAMKDYGRWLGTPEAVAFSGRVRDFSEWLVEAGVPPVRATGRTIVVQDPCHLRHVQRRADAVRTVLEGAYDLVDTADEGLCCGAGGAYFVHQPELAGAIRDRKIAALTAAAGDAPLHVASANPGCAMHLGAGGVDVHHPAELLRDALVEAPERRGQG